MKYFKTGFTFTIGAFAASAVVGLITFAVMGVGLWFEKLFKRKKKEDDPDPVFWDDEVEE